MFVKIDTKAGIVLAIVGILVVWALVDPESLASQIETVTNHLTGALK